MKEKIRVAAGNSFNSFLANSVQKRQEVERPGKRERQTETKREIERERRKKKKLWTRLQIRFYALCLAAPWCLCALHMYERIRECSGARVCLGCATNLPAAIYIWVYVSVCVAVCVHLSVCVRVFDGDHARSAAALSNREHVRESSRESATKESIGTKRRFFFSSFASLILKIFFPCIFLGFFFTAFQI